MRQSSLALYTFPSPAYIVLIALPYRAAAVYYYLVLVTGLFIPNALTPYLGAVYTILDLSESYLGTVLKI
jgi:hypothetical protein